MTTVDVEESILEEQGPATKEDETADARENASWASSGKAAAGEPSSSAALLRHVLDSVDVLLEGVGVRHLA